MLCVTGASQGEQLRIQLGRAIRQLKAHWRLAAVLVPLLQLPAAAPLGVESTTAEAAGDSPAAASGSSEQAADPDLLQQQTAAVQLLLSAAKGFGLEDCWQWKPLLDGKQVRAVWVVSSLVWQAGQQGCGVCAAVLTRVANLVSAAVAA